MAKIDISKVVEGSWVKVKDPKRGTLEGTVVAVGISSATMFVVADQQGRQSAFAMNTIKGWERAEGDPEILAAWDCKPTPAIRKPLYRIQSGDWMAYTGDDGKQTNGLVYKVPQMDRYMIRTEHPITATLSASTLDDRHAVLYDANPFTSGTAFGTPIRLDLDVDTAQEGMWAETDKGGTISQGTLARDDDGSLTLNGIILFIPSDGRQLPTGNYRNIRVWSGGTPDDWTLAHDRSDRIMTADGSEYYGSIGRDSDISDRLITFIAYAATVHGKAQFMRSPLQLQIPLANVRYISRSDPRPYPEGYATIGLQDKGKEPV